MKNLFPIKVSYRRKPGIEFNSDIYVLIKFNTNRKLLKLKNVDVIYSLQFQNRKHRTTTFLTSIKFKVLGFMKVIYESCPKDKVHSEMMSDLTQNTSKMKKCPKFDNAVYPATTPKYR